jgi:tRNA 2-thiouridine synthesizing protein B
MSDYESLVKLVSKAVEKGESVAILHIQDACIAVASDGYLKKVVSSGIEVYALKEDCEARGLLQKIKNKIRIVDYEGWVNLVMNKHDKIVSWT